MKRLKSNSGQAGTEYMLLISIAVLAIVAAAITFIPYTTNGVQDLSADVQELLRMNHVNVAYDLMNSFGDTRDPDAPPPPKDIFTSPAKHFGVVPPSDMDGSLYMLTNAEFPTLVPMACTTMGDKC